MKLLVTIVFASLISLIALNNSFPGFFNFSGNTSVEQDNTIAEGVSIVDKWDLPDVLKEVSGIAYISAGKFACVQDEMGTIFIYNTSSNKIEKEIEFAGPGDFEGLTIIGNTAYIIRADGVLFEVNMNSEKPSAKEYKTALTVQHNVEGLCNDKKNNRLLLAIKNGEPGNDKTKGIYEFSLSSKKFNNTPVYQLDLNNELIANNYKKKKTFMPSEIGIHPVTDEIYVLDGTESNLLIMDRSSKIKSLHDLGKDFKQPEGITFSPNGDMFISNEGTKNPGNIMHVKLK